MTEENSTGFKSYGAAFQEKIIQALLSDHRWAQQMSEVICVSYFDERHMQFLARCYLDFHLKYKAFPSFDMLVTIARDELKIGNDTIMCGQIVSLLKTLSSNPCPGDLPYVKEQALDFCRRQAMKSALEKSIDLINSSKYDAVVHTMRQAISIGTLPSIGHIFFEDIDARLTPLNRCCVATGLEKLDSKLLLNGGLGKGELGIVVAPTGVGKSHFLTMIGANAIRQGKNVVHYTFELSEAYTGIRYDSNFCDISSSDIFDHKDKIKLKYNSQKKWGRLFVKEYPCGTCSVVTIRNHLEKLEITEGIRPDMLIIDYADEMRSTKMQDGLRHELKLIYQEVRSMGQELAIPIWSASQGNRESATTEIVDLHNMSEAYGKAMVADVIVSISRKPMEKAKGLGRLFVAKNRFGKDGLVYPIKIDTAKSTIEITSDSSIDIESQRSEDKEINKDAIRKKWQEIKEKRELDIAAVE